MFFLLTRVSITDQSQRAFSNGMAQNVYWENRTYKTVPILIFFTGKAVKGIRERFSYQILKKCEVIFSKITNRLDS